MKHKHLKYLVGVVLYFKFNFVSAVENFETRINEIASMRMDRGAELLLESRLLAEKIANDARNHPELNEAVHIQGIDKLIGILSSPTLFQLKGNNKDWDYCKVKGREKTLAYVSKDHSIHICKRAIAFTTRDLAQVLIHEASHLAFDRPRNYDYEHSERENSKQRTVVKNSNSIKKSQSLKWDTKIGRFVNPRRSEDLMYNECRATKWEVSIVRLSGRTPFGNKYIETCKLQGLGPYRLPSVFNLFET